MDPECITADQPIETPETCCMTVAAIIKRLWEAAVIEGPSRELVIIEVSESRSLRTACARPVAYFQLGDIDLFVVDGERIFSMIEYVDNPDENTYVLWKYSAEAFRHLFQARLLSEGALITAETLGSLAERHFSFDTVRHSVQNAAARAESDKEALKREIDARAVGVFAARVLSVLFMVDGTVSADLVFGLILVGEKEIEKMVEDYSGVYLETDPSDLDGFLFCLA